MSALKRLSHRHLVRVVGSYTDQKSVAFLMEPVAECNLMTYLSQPPSHLFNQLPSLRTYYGCLASAVAYLHQQKIRHCDLKPDNILLKAGALYLADFGAALDWSRKERSTTFSNAVPRTARYMAPEVAKDAPRNSASDMWSLGITYLDMTTVLRGKTIKQMHGFLQKNGNGHAHVWNNSRGAYQWFEVLRQSEAGPESDNEPLSWIKELLHADPLHRPRARTLLRQILESTARGSFCGFCCGEEDDDDVTETSSLSSHSSSGASYDTARQDIESAELFQRPTFFHLAPHSDFTAVERWLDSTSVPSVPPPQPPSAPELPLPSSVSDASLLPDDAVEDATSTVATIVATAPRGLPESTEDLTNSPSVDAYPGYAIVEDNSDSDEDVDEYQPAGFVIEEDGSGSETSDRTIRLTVNLPRPDNVQDSQASILQESQQLNVAGAQSQTPEGDSSPAHTSFCEASVSLAPTSGQSSSTPREPSEENRLLAIGHSKSGPLTPERPTPGASMPFVAPPPSTHSHSSRSKQSAARPLKSGTSPLMSSLLPTAPKLPSSKLAAPSSCESMSDPSKSAVAKSDKSTKPAASNLGGSTSDSSIPAGSKSGKLTSGPSKSAAPSLGEPTPGSSILAASDLGPLKAPVSKASQPTSRPGASGSASRSATKTALQNASRILGLDKPNAKKTGGNESLPPEPEFTASTYMQEVWEKASSAPTSVLSESSRDTLYLTAPLIRQLDRSFGHLERHCYDGRTSRVKELLECECNPGTKQTPRLRPLKYAVRGASAKHLKCVKLLLEHGANINARERVSGKTALHWAIENRDFKVGNRSGYASLIYLLLEHGADPNVKDHLGDYPLLKILSGDYEPLKAHRRDALAVLLQPHCSTNVNIMPPGTINLPLHLAVRRKDHWAVGMLLAAGARVNQVNGAGVTPLLLAATGWNRAGGHEKEQREVLRQLLYNKAEVNERGSSSQLTALHHAVSSGRDDLVQILLGYGADAHLTDAAGQTPCQMAAASASKMSTKTHASIMKRLLQALDLDVPRTKGQCPIATAVSRNDVAMAKRLLELGSDVNHRITTEPNRSILQHAILHDFTEMVELLTEAGAVPGDPGDVPTNP